MASLGMASQNLWPKSSQSTAVPILPWGAGVWGLLGG